MGISLAKGRVAAGQVVLIWLLVGALLSAHAQTSQAPAGGAPCALNLAGRITDQRTGEPLPGTVLRLAEASAAEAADADGHYHFHQLCAGQCHLHATFVGYAEQVLTVTVRGSVTALDIKLKAAASRRWWAHVYVWRR